MKTTKAKILKSTIIIILSFLLLQSYFVMQIPHQANAENTILVNSSNFIYSPSFSTYYDGNLFFIDTFDGDNYFKVFLADDNNNNYAKHSQKLSSNVVYAYSANNLFFILFEDNLSYISLDDKNYSLTKLVDTEQNQYSSIFVSFSDNEFVITLTPANFDETNSLIIIFNFETKSKQIITIDDSNLSSELPNIRLATIQLSENNYCYLYFGETKLKYLKLNFSNFSQNQIIKITNAANEISSSSLDVNSQTEIAEINILKFNDKNHFLITYKRQLSDGIDYYRNIYSFDFSQELNFKFENINLTNFSKNTISQLPFVSSFEDYIIYPTKAPNPQIIYLKILQDQIVENHIENPIPTIKDYYEMNFKVKSVQNDTYLLANPWDITSSITIPAGSDILIVGEPLIDSAKVENLYYCLYTSKNSDSTFTNNYGYISAEKLDNKNELTLQEAKLALVVKVIPNTSLYALPSKAADIKLETDGNFAVEIVDLMCGYKTDTISWVRVTINNVTGYIDRSRINFSPDKVDFIVTNATITRDNTFVYQQASSSSAVIFNEPLSKGKSVYIDGVRDTKTGFTKIKFNDEYGNEFEGYIKTENIKSNSWSSLQIIGSILISINFGILILIIIFKKKKLSQSEQQKITSENDEILN